MRFFRLVHFVLAVPALFLFAAAACLVSLIAIAVAQTDVADAVKIACDNNGALLTWLGYAGAAVIPASLLTNIKALHSVPVIGVLVNIVALNWRSWLRDAATNAAKTAPALLLLIGLGSLVGACSTAQVSSAASAVQTACKDATAAAGTAQSQLKGGALDTANSIATYVTASCGTADAIAAVAQNPTTAEWLGTLTGQLQTLTAAPATGS